MSSTAACKAGAAAGRAAATVVARSNQPRWCAHRNAIARFAILAAERPGRFLIADLRRQRINASHLVRTVSPISICIVCNRVGMSPFSRLMRQSGR